MSSITLVDDGRCVQVRVPMQMKRRNGRKMIIAPEGMQNSTQTQPDCNTSLAITIAKAHHWHNLLITGRVSTITELADRLNLNRSFVARVMRLTLLAPDIVEAILSGNEPSGLTYAGLTATETPASWSEQRAKWGFETPNAERARRCSP